MKNRTEYSYIQSITDYEKCNEETAIFIKFFDAIYTTNLDEVKQCLENPTVQTRLNTLKLRDIAEERCAPYILSHTPLSMALEQLSRSHKDTEQSMEIVALLLEKGADCNQPFNIDLPTDPSDKLAYSYLHLVLENNTLRREQKDLVLSNLIQHGAQVTSPAYYCDRGNGKSTATHMSYIRPTEMGIGDAEFLIKNGANPDELGTEIKTRLPRLFQYLQSFFNFLFPTFNGSSVTQEQLDEGRKNAQTEVATFQEELKNKSDTDSLGSLQGMSLFSEKNSNNKTNSSTCLSSTEETEIEEETVTNSLT